MFIGHYGVALALKRAEPKVSLGTLFFVTQFVDVLWGVFLLLGWERARIEPGITEATPINFLSYPLSHSLLSAIVWAAVAAAVYYSWPTRDTARHGRATVVVAIAAASHWFLDVIVHRPDLPLAGPQSTKVGLGLWDSLPGTIAVELLLVAAGLALYLTISVKRHRPRRGRVAVLMVVLLGLAAASYFGPVPENMTMVAVGALVMYLGLTALAAWADRRRHV
ncbi:MAG TPA: hypothetical protein VK845_08710 [Gemmatimonadales bacterium]|nr:hypothetical protein [Gemmatimonadales bacterium]